MNHKHHIDITINLALDSISETHVTENLSFHSHHLAVRRDKSLLFLSTGLCIFLSRHKCLCVLIDSKLSEVWDSVSSPPVTCHRSQCIVGI